MTLQENGDGEAYRQQEEEQQRATRRLAAIMFTDMVGYTSLSQRNEPLSFELLEEHRRILRPLFAKHDGREVKTIGDSFLVEFSSALAAVNCAEEIQRTVSEFCSAWPLERRITLRIGIHLGDVIHSNDDVYGDAVNVASRIQQLAEPGGICITRQVYDDVRNKIQCAMVAMGDHELKHVELPIQIYKVLLASDNSPADRDLVKTGNDVLHRSREEARRRIAVLPIVNISADPKDEYFSDGLTEELIATLSRIPNLRVIARTSVARYKNGSKRVSEVGQELNVGVVLEGSVRKQDTRLRATFELDDATSEEQLWTHSFDSSIDDVFEIQKQIARRVAAALKVELLAEDEQEIGKRCTDDGEAHLLYMKGRFHLTHGLEEGFQKAAEYFEQAVERDPCYAPAYIGLAESHLEEAFYSSFSDELVAKQEYSRARAFVEKALALDGSLPEAQACLARILSDFEWDLPRAEREYQKALEVNPNLSVVHSMYSYFLLCTGRRDESIAEARHALELDPLSAQACGALGVAFLYSGRYDEAIEQFRNSLEIDPNDAVARSNLGVAFAQKGMFEEAIVEAKRAVALTSLGRYLVKTNLMFVFSKAGMIENSRQVLEEMKLAETEEQQQQNVDSARPCPPIALARAYSILGEKEKALELLEQARRSKSANLLSVGIDFAYDSLRSEPRFNTLLETIGLSKLTTTTGA